ncbi:MAG: metallophosphoesterase [Bdellovibrionaceae bacterium]|nr:metallophosphoesterase [Pseudobdellovibrionaceae bacterium]
MKIRIAHLSDPHFGANYPEVVQSLTTCVEKLQPDLILMTGDITQRARLEQFQAAHAFVQSLSQFQWAVVPGNHDIPLYNWWLRLFKPYNNYEKAFNSVIEKKIPVDQVQVFTFNSTSRFRMVQGAMSKKQIKDLVRKKLTKTDVRIACFHHPVDCPKNVDEKNLLRNRDEVMKVFAQTEMDLVLGGHIHDPLISLSGDRYPTINRQNVISVAGTCLSWRTRAGAPNSFNLIDIEVDPHQQPRMIITRYDLSETGYFAPILVHSFIRDAQLGWSKV